MNHTTLAVWNLAEKMGFSDAMLVAVAGIAVVMLELVLITVLILGLSKLIRAVEYKLLTSSESAPKAAPAVSAAPVAAAPVAAAPAANISTGKLELIDVDEPTAAVIMAIVSNESGIPLERLSFKSIKKVEG